MHHPADTPAAPTPIDPFLLLDALPDGVALLDRNGTVRYHNAAWRRNGALATLEGDYIAAHQAAYALADADAQALHEGLRAVLDGVQPHYEHEYAALVDSRPAWLSTIIVPYAPAGALVQQRDITARKQAEEALRASERQFRAYAQHAPDTFYVLDLTLWRTIYVNRGGFLGYSEEELRSSGSIGKAIHPDDVELVGAHWQDLMQGGEGVIEYRVRSKDGAWEWVESRETVLSRDAIGRPLQVLVALTLITERKQALAELRNSRQRFQALFDALPDAVFVESFDGRVLDVNPAACRLHRCERDDLVGAHVLDLTPEEQRAAVAREFPKLADGELNTFESVSWTFDGQAVPVEVRVSTIDYDGARTLLLQVRDISERKQAEAERRRLQDEMIAMQAAALAELSTPLIPIADDVLVMPLIGTIDAQRAQRVLETLLHGIEQQRARIAILDITGVPVVDTQVASALVQAAQAAQLLGTEMMLSGIRPEVAQTLVGLGCDLSGIRTPGTLQSCVARALVRRK